MSKELAPVKVTETIPTPQDLDLRMGRLLLLRAKEEELNRVSGARDEWKTWTIGEFSGLDPNVINCFHLIDFSEVIAMTDKCIYSTFLEIEETKDPTLLERTAKSFDHLRKFLNEELEKKVA